MSNISRLEIIKANPIEKRLDAFRSSLESLCARQKIPEFLGSLHPAEDDGNARSPSEISLLTHTELKNLALDLVSTLQNLPVCRLLPSSTGRGTLAGDLSRFFAVIDSSDFEIERILPLLRAILNRESDENILNKAAAAVTESTPPRPLPFRNQTPLTQNSSSFPNSFEHRKYMDDVLKEELVAVYVGIPGFLEAFFGGVEDLTPAAMAVFQKCKQGPKQLYSEESGWRDWPEHAKEKDVLHWLTRLTDRLGDLFSKHKPTRPCRRGLRTEPSKPLAGSTADRKLDIAIVDDAEGHGVSEYNWSHILVPGELKSNAAFDTISQTWRDLGRYAREIFAAQDGRRFVLGFTLCGPLMRLWSFDRAGAIASPPFNINEDGHQFVTALLGFLCMDAEQLGFDPTISRSDGTRYIEIERDGRKERLIIDEVMRRTACVAGRATTCWKAHREGDESRTPLVIKDSWQYQEREEEGLLLQEATEKDVANVARYYHHETVRVGGEEDDIRDGVRKGLDATTAANYKPERSMPLLRGTERGRSAGSAGKKRSSSEADAELPPNKRPCSNSPTKSTPRSPIPNRVHRRVVVRDYGKPIYRASSRLAMLEALVGCIEGYENLHKKAKMWHCDISIGNLMMNEDHDNPSWPAFLIDLDLAVRVQREQPSGARGKTGTRAFMAIGALLDDEERTFMHDLESFFWVLFWICIHHDGPGGKGEVKRKFEKWNFMATDELAELKKGTVSDETDFLKISEDNFTLYYQPLIPYLNRLRRVVFPDGVRRKVPDQTLYIKMRKILQAAHKDPSVAE